LDSISDHLNIDFIHHNAEEDARACSLIAIKACEQNGVDSFEKLARSIHLNHGYIRPNEYNPVGGFSGARVKDFKPQTDTFDESCPVFNKSFVFTGTLESMTRSEAIQRTVDYGGICHQTVRKNSNFLVIGIQDYRKLKDGKRSNKMKKAESLILRGSDLEIINEDDFLRMFS
jgi:DNA polymerase-3 subunit epsilon